MHPIVAATLATQITNDRQDAARHARATRSRRGRAIVRRVLAHHR